MEKFVLQEKEETPFCFETWSADAFFKCLKVWVSGCMHHVQFLETW